MKIQVLGSGCPTCKKLYEVVQEIIDESEAKVEVEYITGMEGMQKIVELGAVSSPLLVINGTIAMIGYTPNTRKIKETIEAHLRK